VVGAWLVVWADPEQAVSKKASGSKSLAIEVEIIFILHPGLSHSVENILLARAKA